MNVFPANHNPSSFGKAPEFKTQVNKVSVSGCQNSQFLPRLTPSKLAIHPAKTAEFSQFSFGICLI